MLSLKYNNGSPMTDHLNIFSRDHEQFIIYGIKFNEEIQSLLLFYSLPDFWETHWTSPNGVMSMDSAKSSVLNEVIRRKTQGSS